MPKYVIEREIPGSDLLTAGQMHDIAQKSCQALAEISQHVQWVQSFVTADKWYCIYIAPNEEAVREHARCGGFPANEISAVITIADPVTAESVAVEN
jgi:hypothetical protein